MAKKCIPLLFTFERQQNKDFVTSSKNDVVAEKVWIQRCLEINFKMTRTPKAIETL